MSDHYEIQIGDLKEQIEWGRATNLNYKGFGYRGGRLRVHIMVHETFIGQITKGHEINHIDGNKHNNHYRNLEMCTKQENMTHAKKMGLAAIGSRHGGAKLKEADIPVIFKLDTLGNNHEEIGEMYNVSKTCIYKIINRKRWKHVKITD